MSRRYAGITCLSAIATLAYSTIVNAQTDVARPGNTVVDPGPRGGAAGAGGPLSALSPAELSAFARFKLTFQETDGAPGGLGPMFNLDSCGGCHAHPAVGGSSPAVNPQVAMATQLGARNTVPSFISSAGPIREARRVAGGSDIGGVVNLFTIAGRTDAPGCNLRQPDFSNPGNFRFRIPTPVFGLGLVEAITDQTLRDNLAGNSAQKLVLGISGRLNTNGNDGTVTRFGWKAQNKSLLLFSGEAYNVEIGITNELFNHERDESASCIYTGMPEDTTNLDTGEPSDIVQFTIFMRFLDQPRPQQPADAAERTTLASGRTLFDKAACSLCHTPSLTTGKAYSPALSQKTVNLFSDLALHSMGSGLADGISQGQASGSEFRTAPLWGLGQRLFFLHDGRTNDLLEAIRQHAGPGSEANLSIAIFTTFSDTEKQQLLKFLRSL